MNERLENLFEQAFEYARTESDERSNRAVVEKFAELIVRECAKIADVADENQCEWIGGNILTHFGVAE